MSSPAPGPAPDLAATTGPAAGTGAPALVPEPQWRGLDPGLLRLRRLTTLLDWTLTGAVAGVVLVVLDRPLAAVAAVVAAAVLLLVSLQTVTRRFHAWGYAEREDDLLLRRGVLIRRTTVVPYGRMQYVDVTAGPLDRRFGIATVVLHTAAAATDARIPGVRSDEAARLRDRLAALGEARSAGI